MIVFKTLSLCNFQSVGAVPQVLHFDTAGLTLVLGANADIGGANSRNGVGKTTALQGLFYVLFGKPLADIRLDNLVNNINGRAMLVTLDAEIGGRRVRIERGRKPDVLRLFMDGGIADDAQGDSRRTQAVIERLLGMTPALFRHIVALNTVTPVFMRLREAEQRPLVEEMLGLTLLGQRAEVLGGLIRSCKEDIRGEEARIMATTEANRRIETALAEAAQAQAAWQATHAAQLDALDAAAAELAGTDFAAEAAAFDRRDAWDAAVREQRQTLDDWARDRQLVEREIAQFSAAIAQREQTDETGRQAQLSRLEAELRRHDEAAARSCDDRLAELRKTAAQTSGDAAAMAADLDRRRAEIVRLETAIAQPEAQRCAACGQPLTQAAQRQAAIAGLRQQLAGAQTALARDLAAQDRLRRAAAAAERQADQLVADHAQRQASAAVDAAATRIEIATLRASLLTEQDATEAACAALREQRAAYATALHGVISEIAAGEAALHRLGSRPVCRYASREAVWQARAQRDLLARDRAQAAAQVNPYAAQVATLRATLQEVPRTVLLERQLTLKHLDCVLKLLTSKDSFIRKRLIDRNLAQLNARLAHYTAALGLPHGVTFGADMRVDIALLGHHYDFEQLSRGEMSRLCLSIDWAFRDVWESMNVPINLLFADEVVDTGMDDWGAETAMQLLNRMAREQHRNVFLVSHKQQLIGQADHILTVEKRGDFTHFLNDDGAAAVDAA